MARAQMFLCPENGSLTVAKARPCVNISDTCAGRYVVEAISTFPKYPVHVVGSSCGLVGNDKARAKENAAIEK